METIHPFKLAQRFFQSVLPYTWIVLLILAAFLLHHEWQSISIHELQQAIAAIGTKHLVCAVILTLMSFLCNAGLDVVGVRWLGYKFSPRLVMMTALVAGIFSMNGGGTILGGGTIRMRIYGQNQMSIGDVGRLTIFLLLVGWMGHSILAGTLLLLRPPQVTWLTPVQMQVSGLCLILLVVIIVVTACCTRRWTWLPTAPVLLIAVAISTLDWLFAGLAMRCLLPESLPTLPILAAVSVGQAIGAASHIPGGVGVMEYAVSQLFILGSAKSTLAAALLSYRFVYYLIPFGIAVAAVAAWELWNQRNWAKVTLSHSYRVWNTIAPRLACMITLVGGFILMLSANTPIDNMRRALLDDWIPLPFIETSHLLSSICGTILIIVSAGLMRRVQAAWWMAVILFVGGVVFSLLKGFDWEEALLSSLFLLMILPLRHRFHRHAAIWTRRFSLQWWIFLATIAGIAIWIGFYTSKHVDYQHDLWWQCSIDNDASRTLRSIAAIALCLCFVALAQLLRPTPPRQRLPDMDPQKVMPLVSTTPSTCAALVMLGDKQLLYSEMEDAFLMYADRGRSRVAIGTPVGNADAYDELYWRFVELAQDEGMRPVFYQLSSEMLPTCIEMGYRIYKLGEQAMIPLADFNIQSPALRKLRKVANRFEREKWCFEIWQPSTVEQRLAELVDISDSWLKHHKAQEKGFSLGFFDPVYMCQFPVAVLSIDGKIQAFANIWPGDGQTELSIDLMRHRDDSPNGVMDALMWQIIEWGKSSGYARFDLGMAPLSGLADHPLAPLWSRLGGFVFNRGDVFYNFTGLRAWKSKFLPDWQPRFLALPMAWDLPVAMMDVTALIAKAPTQR